MDHTFGRDQKGHVRTPAISKSTCRVIRMMRWCILAHSAGPSRASVRRNVSHSFPPRTIAVAQDFFRMHFPSNLLYFSAAKSRTSPWPNPLFHSRLDYDSYPQIFVFTCLWLRKVAKSLLVSLQNIISFRPFHLCAISSSLKLVALLLARSRQLCALALRILVSVDLAIEQHFDTFWQAKLAHPTSPARSITTWNLYTLVSSFSTTNSTPLLDVSRLRLPMTLA